jgi:hypothetical protein
MEGISKVQGKRKRARVPQGAGRRGHSPDRLLSIPAQCPVASCRKQDSPRGISSQRAVDPPQCQISAADV